MASAYALPLDSSTHVYGHHAHGHSRSHHHLRSERSSSWLGQINEVAVKRTPSSTNLDSQPPAGPPSHQDVAAANAASVEMNETIALGRPFTPTKARYQSESEQGQLRPSPKARPATHAYGFASRVTEPDAVISEPWVTAREALTAILVPLPYVFASLAYPSAAPSTAPSSPYERLMDPVSADERTAALSGGDAAGASALLQASCLASGTLLLAGLIGALSPPDKVLDRRKRGFSNANVSLNKGGDILQNDAPRRIVARVLSVGLPYYAAAQLGGARTSFVLLTALGSGLTGLNINPLHQNFVKAWARVVSLRKLTCAVLLLAFLLDLSGLTTGFGTRHLFLGYVSLALSIFFFSPPLAVTGWSPISTPYAASTGSISALETPFDTPKQAVKASLSEPLSPLVSSSEDIKLTLVSGGILSVFTVLYAAIVSTHPPLSYGSILFAALAMSSALGSIFLSLPISLRSSRKIGVALGYFVTIIFGYSLHADAWKGIVALGVLSCFAYMAVLYDTVPKSPSLKGQDNHYQNPTKHAHHDHSHLHDRSKISGQLIALCTPGSIIHSILIEKDSRRIAYFACLNLAFMLVQFFYGFVSGSLGLLTDSIHMLFDCLGLAVGLAAAVMTKRPPNTRFPYGYGKIDTLSGFANGIFLMLVSVEIVFDAFEKLYEGHEMRRLNELLIVSILGLLVNIVGLTAFGHAHHGHDHDHGHSHDGHGHSHDNENMHGIFLHILADTLGSVAVIVSTILTKWTGWAGWDPIASTLIAILIALSAYPLVKSSGMRLLLSMPADVEYKIRNTLQEISSLRGVVGYTVPKFWLEDAGAAHADAHAHDHSHAHTHEHSHDHVSKHDSPCSSHGPEEHKHHHHDDHHSHGHGHDHDHKHSSCNGHSHDHDHDHDHIHAHDHNHEHGHGHSHSHSHSHDHGHSHEPHQKKILGVIHIIASRLADLADVQERTMQFLRGRGMDVLVHVEREGDGFCWCGGGKQVSG